eukprot:TRINITY_DN6807_c0_g1_i12.p1 TRINITY_DN6807_c0_g1~~TRINITY_DN6807_c0_g1_i12.p1  ORF type:complete len:285 (-),score=31.56 TRINITY_DN6807_c0_g1_i12:101-955(-)
MCIRDRWIGCNICAGYNVNIVNKVMQQKSFRDEEQLVFDAASPIITPPEILESQLLAINLPGFSPLNLSVNKKECEELKEHNTIPDNVLKENMNINKEQKPFAQSNASSAPLMGDCYEDSILEEMRDLHKLLHNENVLTAPHKVQHNEAFIKPKLKMSPTIVEARSKRTEKRPKYNLNKESDESKYVRISCIDPSICESILAPTLLPRFKPLNKVQRRRRIYEMKVLKETDAKRNIRGLCMKVARYSLLLVIFLGYNNRCCLFFVLYRECFLVNICPPLIINCN